MAVEKEPMRTCPAGGGLVELGELALGRGELGLDALGRPGEHPSGVGEHGPGGRAIEHAHARLPLQQLDLLADGRGGQVLGVRGGDDAPGPGAERPHGATTARAEPAARMVNPREGMTPHGRKGGRERALRVTTTVVESTISTSAISAPSGPPAG